jgi:hypothetical protein
MKFPETIYAVIDPNSLNEDGLICDASMAKVMDDEPVNVAEYSLVGVEKFRKAVVKMMRDPA